MVGDFIDDAKKDQSRLMNVPGGCGFTAGIPGSGVFVGMQARAREEIVARKTMVRVIPPANCSHEYTRIARICHSCARRDENNRTIFDWIRNNYFCNQSHVGLRG